MGFAKNFLLDFKARVPVVSIPKSAKKGWSPPVMGSYKTNFDGVIFEEFNEAGIGVVIPNAKGEIMVALLEKICKRSQM